MGERRQYLIEALEVLTVLIFVAPDAAWKENVMSQWRAVRDELTRLGGSL